MVLEEPLLLSKYTQFQTSQDVIAHIFVLGNKDMCVWWATSHKFYWRIALPLFLTLP